MQIAPDATSASRQLARRGEVQVREEDLPRSQPSELVRERLLDLEHEVARRPHVVDPREPRARPDVGLVGERAADARAGLDDDLVALRGELARAAGREGDAVLVGLDLANDADLHRVAAAAGVLSCSITRRSLRGAASGRPRPNPGVSGRRISGRRTPLPQVTSRRTLAPRSIAQTTRCPETPTMLLRRLFRLPVDDRASVAHGLRRIIATSERRAAPGGRAIDPPPVASRRPACPRSGASTPRCATRRARCPTCCTPRSAASSPTGRRRPSTAATRSSPASPPRRWPTASRRPCPPAPRGRVGGRGEPD